MPFAIQPTVDQLQRSQGGNVEAALDAALKGYSAFQTAQDAKLKRESDKVTMYGKLREIGLTPKDAYDRTLSGTGIPMPTGDSTTKEKAELAKTQAATAKLQAETERIKAGKSADPIPPGTQQLIDTQLANARSVIMSGNFGTKERAKRYIRENYNRVNADDPSLQDAYDEIYGQSGQVRKSADEENKSIGVMDRLSGFWNKRREPPKKKRTGQKIGRFTVEVE